VQSDSGEKQVNIFIINGINHLVQLKEIDSTYLEIISNYTSA